jgi:O-succinylbenzoic acid--CoA ligase
MKAVTCPIFAGARRWPRATALITPQRLWSYRELDSAVAQAAMQLSLRGVRRGDLLAVHLPNDWRYPAVLFALLRLGACAVLTNLRLPPAAVAKQLRAAGVHTIITAGEIKLSGICQFDAAEILGPGEVTARATPRLSLNAPAVVFFTSASTGAAKAVALSFGNLYFNARGSNRNIVLGRGDRWQLALPLYHVSGLGALLRAWLAGAAVVIPEGDDALEQATHISLVPTQLRRLLEKRRGVAALRRMKAVLIGGAATDARLLASARAAGIRALTTYGMTEMASQVCTLPPNAPRNKWFTSGRLLPLRELKFSAAGEILVRGRCRFLGYLVRGEVRRLPAARWFATGDLGALDSDGYLTVRGRKDNMFISGGENIQPEEIEQTLLALPGVAAAVVVPRADNEFGARPVAFVQCAQKISGDKLRLALRRKLPTYKVPVEFLPWPKAVPAGLKISRPFFAARLPR